MSQFLNALTTEDSRTENGMLTNSTSGTANVDLFFKAGAMRTASEKDIATIFASAYGEDRLTALRLLFWSRDVRGGAGERRFFREGLKHLAVSDPEVLTANIHLVPEYGRWDDLLTLLDTNITFVEHAALTVIANALNAKDKLCAKWMPRPHGSKTNKVLANKIRRFMGLTPKQYRQVLVEATEVIESAMCAKNWSAINFQHVPSLALARYTKAFAKNDADRFATFKEALQKGEAKVNAGAIYPYDVIKNLNTSRELIVAQAQWDAIPLLWDPAGERILPLVDVSGSMLSPASGNSVTCMDVSVSLGMYIAERNIGAFKDHFLTFTSEPTLVKLSGNLLDRIRQVKGPVGYNTNLNAAFETILTQAVRHNVPVDEMPTKILILSDMEFDDGVRYDETAQTMIERKYAKAGYPVPYVVYWNIQSRSIGNVPVKQGKRGVALVSGFSPNIIKTVLGDVDPVNVMLRVVNSVRYAMITIPGANVQFVAADNQSAVA